MTLANSFKEMGTSVLQLHVAKFANNFNELEADIFLDLLDYNSAWLILASGLVIYWAENPVVSL